MDPSPLTGRTLAMTLRRACSVALELPQRHGGELVTGRRTEPELLARTLEVTAVGQQHAEVVVAVHVPRGDAAAVRLLGGLDVQELVGVEVAEREPGLQLAQLRAALEHEPRLGEPAGVAE